MWRKLSPFSPTQQTFTPCLAWMLGMDRNKVHLSIPVVTWDGAGTLTVAWLRGDIAESQDWFARQGHINTTPITGGQARCKLRLGPHGTHSSAGSTMHVMAMAVRFDHEDGLGEFTFLRIETEVSGHKVPGL